MERRRWVLGGISALVSAALLTGLPPFVRGAGHGGGGHGGGGGHTFGGFHGGGFHGGVFHGHGFYGRGFYGRGFYGGHYPGFFGYGYPWWYSGFGLGVGLGYGLGYGYGYPSYPYPGPGYGGPAYYAPPVCVAPPPPPVAAPVVPAAPVGVAQVSAGEVLFSIRVPDSADVWINGEKTTQSGPRREFVSSGLEQGRTYTFDIRARWPAADGTTVQLERRVSVHGGERRTVDFLLPVPSPNPVRN